MAANLPWPSASGKMAEQLATITYSIAEPFLQTLKSLRRAFFAQGLKVSKELNISSRIRQKLLIGTDPCAVLLVSPSAETGRALASDPCAAGLTPMHVVVSSRGDQSEVHILSVLPADATSVDRMAIAALSRLQAGIVQAVEKIGMRVMLTP
jgi:uncharacterized protein (DUF302 family)